MSTTFPTRKLWIPKTELDQQTVRRELAEILDSPQFSSSKRYPAFLRFTVECALTGRSELLKERTLGVEVFGRRPDYDTNGDTVVRYTAGEVRKRLQLYHLEHPGRPLHIVLPVGSYVPEFQQDEPLSAEPVALAPMHVPAAPEMQTFLEPAAPRRQRPTPWLAAGLLILLGFALGLLTVQYRDAHTRTAVDEFWAPVVATNGSAVICSGAVIFAPDRISGTATAGRNTDYPFVSMQIADAIARLGGLLEVHGKDYEVRASTATSLPDLRDRPIILLGGYNNPWTVRLTEPLRFHFTPEPTSSLVDRDRPGTVWRRDISQSYSTSDDYALIARFRDSSTDSTVLVLAGLGRNGTEGAMQFATSPRYMQELRNRIGGDLSTRNIEVIVKTNVIDAKTGAPSIEAVFSW